MRLKVLKLCQTVWIIGLVGLVSACTTNQSPELAQVTVDGLELTSSGRSHISYLKPGADFSNYTSLMIDVAEVRFAKGWEKNMKNVDRHNVNINDQEKLRIINDLSNLLGETFSAELEQNSSFNVVSKPGQNVLALNVSIIDLYINAPDRQQAPMQTTYVANAGSMTLVGELIDSTSGEVLARFANSRKAREEFRLRQSSSVYNRLQAQEIFRYWAKLLREGVEKTQASKL